MAVYAIAVCIIQKDILLCWETGFGGESAMVPYMAKPCPKNGFQGLIGLV